MLKKNYQQIAYALLMGFGGMKSCGEHLNICASLSIWFRLYLDGYFALSTCPIKPSETSSLTASSDWDIFAFSRMVRTRWMTNSSIADLDVILATSKSRELFFIVYLVITK